MRESTLLQFQRKKIAIFSDIHSNSESLGNMLSILEKRSIDFFIFLGDLWTYGCNPNEVLETLEELRKKIDGVFIKGNHEEYYLNPLINQKHPQFITESINWTFRNSKYSKDLINRFEWVEQMKIGNILFAHANPFGYGDWTYLNSQNEFISAFRALQESSYQVGIFGHTHRRNSIVMDVNLNQKLPKNQFNLNEKDKVLFLNPGSIGQPRNDQPGFIILEIIDHLINFEFIDLPSQNALHCEAIAKSDLSRDTKLKLLSKFR